MKILNSKNEVEHAIDENIHNEGWQFFKTPLVSSVTQYPFSNLVFINSNMNDEKIDYLKKELYENNHFQKMNNGGVLRKLLLPGDYNGMFSFLKTEFKNNPLVTFFKFISFIKL